MNESELWLQEAQKIMDNSNIWESYENEILKIYVLFITCIAEKNNRGDDVISRNYIIQKIERLLQKCPIILHEDGKRRYASMLMEMKIQQKMDQKE